MSENQKEKKYELIRNDWIEIVDDLHKKHILFRIRAIRDFSDVKIGDYGGYVESEDNLNQYDESWIYSDAVRISNNAKAWGNSRVYGRAKLYNSAEICDYAIACDTVRLHEDCKVHGRAKVYGNVYIGGIADIGGRCQINGDLIDIRENVKISGNVNVSGYVTMDGVVILDNNVTVDGIGIHIGGHTVIRDSANIRDYAHIMTNDEFISVTNLGSRKAILTAYLTTNRVMLLNTGDFVGTEKEFYKSDEFALDSSTKDAKDYEDFIKVIKERFRRTENGLNELYVED